MFSRFRADTPLRIAAVLALVLLLLDFSARAAQDQHEFGAPAGHGLCAICVYAGGTTGIPTSEWAPPSDPQRHRTPPEPYSAEPYASAHFSILIRGPPSFS